MGLSLVLINFQLNLHKVIPIIYDSIFNLYFCEFFNIILSKHIKKTYDSIIN